MEFVLIVMNKISFEKINEVSYAYETEIVDKLLHFLKYPTEDS